MWKEVFKKILTLRPSQNTGWDPRARNFFKNFFFVAVLLLVSFLLINYVPKNYEPANIKFVKIAGQEIKVDLALTSQTQELGLGGRSNLAENNGMLFVFDKVARYPFWMKDMNFSIDIIWIGENLKVVYIKKNATPESYPESFEPTTSAKYVLEVVSGFSVKNNLKEGDTTEFSYK